MLEAARGNGGAHSTGGHERPTGSGSRDSPVCSSAAPCSAARGPKRDAV